MSKLRVNLELRLSMTHPCPQPCRVKLLDDHTGSNSILVTQPKVWTNKDSFSTRLIDVTVLHPYTHLSPVDLYDYATSASVPVPRQTCLFNSARE